MLTNILNELKTEQAAGNKMAEELVERIDAHIRDLETLKLWVIDRGAARWMSLELLLNGEESGESEPLADDVLLGGGGATEAPKPGRTDATEKPESDQP